MCRIPRLVDVPIEEPRRRGAPLGTRRARVSRRWKRSKTEHLACAVSDGSPGLPRPRGGVTQIRASGETRSHGRHLPVGTVGACCQPAKSTDVPLRGAGGVPAGSEGQRLSDGGSSLLLQPEPQSSPDRHGARPVARACYRSSAGSLDTLPRNTSPRSGRASRSDAREVTTVCPAAST